VSSKFGLLSKKTSSGFVVLYVAKGENVSGMSQLGLLFEKIVVIPAVSISTVML
jgi:hypothetical protein